jgi:hypothetical protein
MILEKLSIFYVNFSSLKIGWLAGIFYFIKGYHVANWAPFSTRAFTQKNKHKFIKNRQVEYLRKVEWKRIRNE